MTTTIDPPRTTPSTTASTAPRTAPVPAVATPLADTASGPSAWGAASLAEGTVTVAADLGPRDAEVLTPGALAFLAVLHDRFADDRTLLLLERQRRMRRIADGEDPDFSPATRPVRDDRSCNYAYLVKQRAP